MTFFFTPRFGIDEGTPADATDDAIQELEFRKRIKGGIPYGKSFTISLRPDTKKPEIETFELPEPIQIDLDKLNESYRDNLKSKLYDKILLELKSELESTRKAELQQQKMLQFWKLVREEQELEDILLMLLMEDE